MSKFKIMLKCDLCGQQYQHGLHRYEGHPLKLYPGLSCCDSCWQANWDGWNPQCEKILLEHLKMKGMPVPPRNSKGLLPRDRKSGDAESKYSNPNRKILKRLGGCGETSQCSSLRTQGQWPRQRIARLVEAFGDHIGLPVKALKIHAENSRFWGVAV